MKFFIITFFVIGFFIFFKELVWVIRVITKVIQREYHRLKARKAAIGIGPVMRERVHYMTKDLQRMK